jgi:two-component system, chemotaxis family, response regulator Rcp1
VVILTTSASETDIVRSYEYHTNYYISKPVDLDGFLKVVQSIDNFWLSVVKLPPKKEAKPNPKFCNRLGYQYS